ncbi:hypothetical protein EWB00_002850, partial [Schistosoma japonicum]
CIHYFLPLNVLSYQNNSTDVRTSIPSVAIRLLEVFEISYTDNVAENKSKWTVEVYHTPLKQSEILSKSQVQVTTKSAVSSRVLKNVAPETKMRYQNFTAHALKMRNILGRHHSLFSGLPTVTTSDPFCDKRDVKRTILG